MEQSKLAHINTDKSKTGVVYITDNENMFIAPEGLSEAEYERLSLETDINAMQKRLAELTSETQPQMQNLEHTEEIERPEPVTATENPPQVTEQLKFSPSVKKFKNVLILDTETTGLNPAREELLQFSAVNLDGETLMNTFIKPEHHRKWAEAQKINHISPETVKDAPKFKEVQKQIQELIDNADLILSYNGKFDMDFLQVNGIKVNPQTPHLDVMKAFAPVYGETYKNGNPKPKKLVDAAKHYGINFEAHNSLGDALATLKVAQKIYGPNLEKLSEEEIEKYSVSKTLPKAMEKESKEYKAFIFRTGSMAMGNQTIIDQMKNDPKEFRLQKTFNYFLENQNDKKAANRLRYALGRYVLDNNPSMVEDFYRNQENQKAVNEINSDLKNQKIMAGAEVLPPFSVQTKNGMKHFANMKISGYDEESGMYLLENGKEQLKMPVKTFQSVRYPERLKPQNQKLEQFEVAEETPAAVIGETVVPEFAMITSHGIQSFKDLKVQGYNAAENSYTLTNGNTTLAVEGSTFNEIMKPERFTRTYDEKTPEYEKLLESQYNDFFKQRENTANNFRHNLSVYCRKEANSPLDALKIADELVSRMTKEEQRKTRLILQQIAKEDETINQVLVRTYYEAIKEVPLDRQKIFERQNEERFIAPLPDVISSKGQLVDENSRLKIGDTIKDMSFNVPKAFGHGKDRIFEDLTVISASKEGNNVILMDKNRSFYEVPRDTLLEGYNKQQEKLQKAEQKHRMANRIDVGWER